MLREIYNYFSRFHDNQDGSILVEAIVVIPIITIFAVGVIEFGNVFWQRHQIETGVRDAARYWARCRPFDSDGSVFMPCDQSTAKNIAMFAVPTGSTPQRVPGWNNPNSIIITPVSTPVVSTSSDIVTVTATVVYQDSPLFSMLGIGGLTIEISHQQRYIGW